MIVFSEFQAHMAVSASCKHAAAIVPTFANWLDDMHGLYTACYGSYIIVKQFFFAYTKFLWHSYDTCLHEGNGTVAVGFSGAKYCCPK